MNRAPIRPQRLKPGDRIAVIAPSGPVHAANLAAGVRFLQDAGFEVSLGERVMESWGYLAGSDASRASDFNRAFADPAVKAIICARGGYGASRILDSLDYDIIAANPKIFVGFSDITGFHLAIRKCAGLVTFHGPGAEMPANEPHPEWNARYLLRALTGRNPIGEIRNPADGPQVATLVPGIASAPVVGGNLSLIAATIGTKYEIETDGCILFVEDVGERPYRLDRMLAQLRMAGKLRHLKGVVIGECVGCDPDPERPSLTLQELFLDYFGGLGVPVMYGLACGHGKFRATIPLGLRATLDAGAGVLRIDEVATA